MPATAAEQDAVLAAHLEPRQVPAFLGGSGPGRSWGAELAQPVPRGIMNELVMAG